MPSIIDDILNDVLNYSSQINKTINKNNNKRKTYNKQNNINNTTQQLNDESTSIGSIEVESVGTMYSNLINKSTSTNKTQLTIHNNITQASITTTPTPSIRRYDTPSYHISDQYICYDINNGGCSVQQADYVLQHISILCHRLHHRLSALQRYYMVYTNTSYDKLKQQMDVLIHNDINNDGHMYTINRCKSIMNNWIDLINNNKKQNNNKLFKMSTW